MNKNFVELNNLSEKERKVALEILKEFSDNGASSTYNNLLYSDYEEIPVDIGTFLHDRRYLGNALYDKEGRFTLFPYWEQLLHKLYPDPLKPAKCNTLALTGGIGLGKSTEAVIIGIYELYRMLCLKDPYIYYGLQPIDLITFAVINITMDAAKGVAWNKLQSMIQSSEWFMQHGTVNKADAPEWKPPKGIELIYGSQTRHVIGRAVFWCLDGETEILTTDGVAKLEDLVGKKIVVPTINTEKGLVNSEICTVKPTAVTQTEYQIELEDGTLIKCTPEHRFMLQDGSYKEAQYLTEADEILEFSPVGYIYKVTNNINGHIYIGKRQSCTFDKTYFGSGKRQLYELKKYGKENFTVEILEWAKSIEDLKTLEEKYINLYFDMNECINVKRTSEGGPTTLNTFKITNGHDERHIPVDEPIPEGWEAGSKQKGIPHPSEKYTESMKRQYSQGLRDCKGKNNPMYGKGHLVSGVHNGHFGKPCSQFIKDASRKANTRWVYLYKDAEYFGEPALISQLETEGIHIGSTGIRFAMEGTNKTYPQLNGKISRRRINS